MTATVDESPIILATPRNTLTQLARRVQALLGPQAVRSNLMTPKDGSEAVSMVTWTAAASSIAANQNDYDVGSVSVAIITPTGANRNITGIAGGATAGGGGRLLVVVCSSAFTLTLTHNDAASAAANRIYIGPAAFVGYILGPQQVAILWYDTTPSLWRLFGGTGTVA